MSLIQVYDTYVGVLPFSSWNVILVTCSRCTFQSAGFTLAWLGCFYGFIHTSRSLIVLSVLPLSSWTLILLAQRPLHLYIARLLAGFWIGVVTTIAPIYIGEISEPRIRGALGNFSSLMTYVGDLFIYMVIYLLLLYMIKFLN